MSDRFLEIIRMANREFQEFIDEVAKNGAKVAKTRGAVRRLEKVAHRLSHVDGFLAQRAGPNLGGAESEFEILKYRENLKALKGVLETLQYSLLVEKSRIENTRANVQAASAWAQSLRQTS
jgi:hypothetical protein